MDMETITKLERSPDKNGQKRTEIISCPAAEPDKKYPPRTGFSPRGIFCPEAQRPNSLWVANLAFPDPAELRREVFLQLSWKEILVHSSGFADLTKLRRFANARSVSPDAGEAGRYGCSVRPVSFPAPTATWIDQMNWFASSLIAILASAQFQSFMRSVFKWGGGVLVAKGYIHENELLQALGAFSTLYGIVMSGVAHSTLGSAATGTAAGPNAIAGFAK